jgi:hypothetical protein
MFRGSIQAIGVMLLTASAWGAASWTEYESGPFRILSDAGDRVAHERLTELEQLRHALEALLGKNDMTAVWPIEIVLFQNQREYGPHAPPQPLVTGPDATLGAWMAETPLPHDLLRGITRQLIEDNAGRMPEWVEQALADLMASVQAKDTKGILAISLGSPPAAGELSEERMRAWAKLEMLAALPEFSNKLRVYLNNLQQGGEEAAATHNAFGMTTAELDKRAEAYYAAGRFEMVPLVGTPVIPGRDFSDMRIAEADVNSLLDAIKADGKEFPPDSPRGLLKKGTREALQAAAKANPRWAAPHAALGDLEVSTDAEVREMKLAATLEPRNSEYWKSLAIAQAANDQYADAEKSWMLAERNAVNDAARTKIHQDRLSMDERRIEYEIAEKKRKAKDEADELNRVKQAAEARIHAAEDAAARRNGTLKPGAAVVPWWNDEDGEKLSGTLTKVECLSGDALRLTVRPAAGPAVQLMIPDSHNLAVKGASEVQFACGVQRPGKPINLVHDGKPDAQQGTVGNVHTVELPQ